MLTPKEETEILFNNTYSTIFNEYETEDTLRNKAKEICKSTISFMQRFTPGEYWCFNGYEDGGINIREIRAIEYFRIMMYEIERI